MSHIHINYIIDNAVNDNKYNTTKSKSTTVHQLKKLIKPIFDILKRRNKKTYRSVPQPDYFMDDSTEIEDNLANELLENEIFEEIDSCEEFAAVSVYNNGQTQILPVHRGQRSIPVHFARTEAGTFFWTSVIRPDCDIDSQGDQNAICNFQLPELQVPVFRWAQA